jgi:1,4-alpha-glucan branching enzyme
MAYVAALNDAVPTDSCAACRDLEEDGFEWIEADDIARSTIAFLRSAEGHPPVLVVCQLHAGGVERYRVGVPVGRDLDVCSSAVTTRPSVVRAVHPEESLVPRRRTQGHAQSLRVRRPAHVGDVLLPAD